MDAIPTDQYIKKIQKQIEDLKGFESELTKVVLDIHTRHMAGIFNEGIDAKYSTNPTLAGSNVFGNTNKFGTTNYTFATKAGSDKYFGSKKKRQDAEWVTIPTGRGARSLIVIEGGYKAIRAASGRRTDKVNMDFTGVLKDDLRLSPVKTNDGWVSGVRKSENVGKLEGLIEKYGKKLDVPKELLNKFDAKFGEIMLKILS